MKRIFCGIMICISVFCMFSCRDQTYADLVKREKKLIQTYVDSHPGYTKLDKGMYFKMLDPGDTAGDTIKTGNTAIVRFVAYTLTTPPDSIRNWNTIDFANPPQFVYGSSTLPCQAWMTAIALMKYQNSIAEIIAPAQTGFSSFANQQAISNWGVLDDATSVTPRRYKLKLRFDK